MPPLKHFMDAARRENVTCMQANPDEISRRFHLNLLRNRFGGGGLGCWRTLATNDDQQVDLRLFLLLHRSLLRLRHRRLLLEVDVVVPASEAVGGLLQLLLHGEAGLGLAGAWLR